MSECGACLYGGDERVDVWRREKRTARKAHTCCECEKPIAVGQPYDYVTMLYDGEWSTWHTCALCAEIRKAFSCNGEVIGNMWEDMNDYVIPSLNTSCFERLQTPEAKAELQRLWMQWKFDRDQ